jgi:hypothetical protein
MKYFVYPLFLLLLLGPTGLTGQGNCRAPMGQRDFMFAYGRLNDIPTFNRNAEIRRLVRTDCLASDQIAQLVQLYYYDQEIYDFAIYAYPYAYDPERYELVAQAMPNASDAARVMDYVRRNPLYVAPPSPPAPPTPVFYPQYVAGYTGRVGCPMPMGPQDFALAKQTLASTGFESTRLEIAKQITGSNCLTSDQVRELVGMFSFESNRLDLAKYAFHRTYDVDNFHQVSQALGYSSSQSELAQYAMANMPVNAPYAGQPMPVVYPPQMPVGYPQQVPVPPVVNPTPHLPPVPPLPDYVPGYTGRIGCPAPMSAIEFNQAVQSIQNSAFENTRAEVAKQILRSRCATVDQISGIIRLMTYDNTKLELAKYAHDYVYDKDNYFRVAEALEYDANKRRLMEYIRNR